MGIFFFVSYFCLLIFLSLGEDISSSKLVILRAGVYFIVNMLDGLGEERENRAIPLDGEKTGSPGQTFVLSLWQNVKAQPGKRCLQGGRKGICLWKNTLNFTDIFTALKHFVNLQQQPLQSCQNKCPLQLGKPQHLLSYG